MTRRTRIRRWQRGGDRWACLVEKEPESKGWCFRWHIEEVIIRTNFDRDLIPRLEEYLAFKNGGTLPAYDLRVVEVSRSKGIKMHSTTGHFEDKPANP
ncbi:MAG: hypothetical protein ACPGJW_09780 [Paracoccaceae bacterium]